MQDEADLTTMLAGEVPFRKIAYADTELQTVVMLQLDRTRSCAADGTM